MSQTRREAQVTVTVSSGVAVERDGATRGEGGAGGDIERTRRPHIERTRGDRSEANVGVIVTVVGCKIGVGGACAAEPFMLHDDVVFVQVETGDVAGC